MTDEFEGHTPGPWFAPRYSTVVGLGIVAAGGRVIGMVAVQPGFNPNGPHEGKREIAYADEVRANGRLIAKAPDLLAENRALAARVEVLEAENAQLQHQIEIRDAAAVVRALSPQRGQ